MSYVSDDKDYTDPQESGIDSTVDRLGDISGEPPENITNNREKASKLANLLEDLTFPCTKNEILDHINRKSPSMGNRINDIFELVNNHLKEGNKYNNAYEIEQRVGLVTKT